MRREEIATIAKKATYEKLKAKFEGVLVDTSQVCPQCNSTFDSDYDFCNDCGYYFCS